MIDPTAARTGHRARTPAGARLGALKRFLDTEAGGAVVLLAAALLALSLANSPLRDAYEGLWRTELSIALGDLALRHDLRDWVNDGLMTLFFLLIGLEVRREFDVGEFRDRRRVAVPIVAAFGGMALPVVIFLAFQPGGEAARGWAMVMATDTAFALGVLALVGHRSSFRLRTFLLTLVIVDDVAAVTVIAALYTSNVEVVALAACAGLLGLMAALRWRGVERPEIYVLLALAIWLAASSSGVHPAVAGVLVGLLTGAYAPRRSSLEAATAVTRAFRQQPTPDLARQAARRITLAVSPNERFQRALHPWTSFVVVPLFALANAGLELSGELVVSAAGSPLVIGIVLALALGKPVGITVGAWLWTRLFDARLTVSWPPVVAASTVGGIGFTMSLLIAELSYNGTQLEQAKLGIFTASVTAAVISMTLFYLLGRLPDEWLQRGAARTAPPLSDLAERMDARRDHVRGPVDAPLTLIEYGDFECPFCARAAPEVRKVLQRFGGRVQFAFRHLPLTDVHPSAALAAEAAEAAGEQGAFWPMHDLLFERQDALGVADVLGYAAELGLDVARFEAELRSGRWGARVEEDVRTAEASGVAGTPTFFINDVRHDGAYDADSLAAALEVAAAASELPIVAPEAA